MAKEKEKDAAAATMAAEVQPAGEAKPAPTLQEIAARDPVMAALLKQLDDMKQEIAALKNPPAAIAATGPVREFAPSKAMIAPKSFNVSLPHGVAAKVTIETDGVREMDFKDHAIAEYNRLMSIVSTVHPYSVGEA